MLFSLGEKCLVVLFSKQAFPNYFANIIITFLMCLGGKYILTFNQTVSKTSFETKFSRVVTWTSGFMDS